MHRLFSREISRAAARPLARLLWLLAAFVLACRPPAHAEVLRLTNDSAFKGDLQLNSAGQVLWGAGNQLYLWTDGAAHQLTQGPTVPTDAALGEGGQVAWVEGTQVDLWSRAGIQQLSAAAGAYSFLSINTAGHVVWDDAEDHLFFWDGVGLRTIPAPGRRNEEPLINDRDEVLWVNGDEGPAQLDLWDGTSVRALSSGHIGVVSAVFNQTGQVAWDQGGIHLWDGESARELFSGRPMDREPDLNALGQAAWFGSNSMGAEIFLWDGSTVRQLSANGRFNHEAQINDAGQVVWESEGGSVSDVLFWDGTQVRQLSTPGVAAGGEQLNDAGQVVWVEAPDNQNSRVMLWDGTAVRQLTGDRGWNGVDLRLNAAGQVAWTSGSQTQNDVYLYTPTSPDTLTLQPGRVVGGWATTGILTLPAPALPGGTLISLASDQPAIVVPARVTVPAGLTTVTFPVETAPVSRATDAVITAVSDAETWQATLTVSPPAPVFVRADPSSLTSGLSGQGTVTLSGPAPRGGIAVTLTSDHPALAAVPGTVTVPSGALSAHFPIGTAATSAATVVTLTAAAGGGMRSALLTVTGVEITGLSLQPAAVPSNHVLPNGEQTTTGTVTLSGPAPVGGAVVELTSDSPLAASVPGHVIVPAGARSAAFPVTTYGVDQDTTVEIQAYYGGATVRAPLRIVVLSFYSFSLSPDPVVASETAMGTIELNGVAPSGGATITLQSANPAVASVPANVIVPAGATKARFPVMTQVTQSVEADTSVSITATLTGVRRTAMLTVIPNALQYVTAEPTDLFAGQSATVIVLINHVAPPGGALVTASSTNQPWVKMPASVTVPEGQLTTTFTVTTAMTDIEWTAVISVSYQRVTRTVTLHVHPVVPTDLWLDPAVVVGGTVEATVTLNGPAALGGSVTLTSSDPRVVPAPAAIPVLPGAAGATFDLPTRPVTTPTRVTLTASLAGVTQKATLVVLPDPGAAPAFSFGLAASPVIGGDATVGAVALAQPAPAGGVTVGLSTDQPEYVAIPPSVVIPEGATTATFAVNTNLYFHGNGEAVTASISATAGGVVRTASLWVVPDGVSLNPVSVRGGQPVMGAFVLPWPAPPGGLVVTLGGDSSSVRTPDSIMLREGEQLATFPVQTLPVTSPLTTGVTASAFFPDGVFNEWTGKLTLEP